MRLKRAPELELETSKAEAREFQTLGVYYFKLLSAVAGSMMSSGSTAVLLLVCKMLGILNLTLAMKAFWRLLGLRRLRPVTTLSELRSVLKVQKKNSAYVSVVAPVHLPSDSVARSHHGAIQDMSIEMHLRDVSRSTAQTITEDVSELLQSSIQPSIVKVRIFRNNLGILFPPFRNSEKVLTFNAPSQQATQLLTMNLPGGSLLLPNFSSMFSWLGSASDLYTRVNQIPRIWFPERELFHRSKDLKMTLNSTILASRFIPFIDDRYSLEMFCLPTSQGEVSQSVATNSSTSPLVQIWGHATLDPVTDQVSIRFVLRVCLGSTYSQLRLWLQFHSEADRRR